MIKSDSDPKILNPKLDPKIGFELEFSCKELMDNFQRFAIVEKISSVGEENLSEEEKEALKFFRKTYERFIRWWTWRYLTSFKAEYWLKQEAGKEAEKKVKKFAISKVEEFINSREKHKGHFVNYLKVPHFLMLEIAEGLKKVEYWIKPTFDYGCVEIIAEPLEASKYKEQDVKFNLDVLLFQTMLERREGDNGFEFYIRKFPLSNANHLSVDYKTGFDGEFSRVLKLFKYIDDDYIDNNHIIIENDKIRLALKNLRAGYTDHLSVINSPYISDLDKDKNQLLVKVNIGEKYRNLLMEIEDSIETGRAKLGELMKDLRTLYLFFPKSGDSSEDWKTAAEGNIREALKRFSIQLPENHEWKSVVEVESKEHWIELWDEHYMAINTENLGKGAKENWRVEFRAVPMPENYEKLLEQIQLVENISGYLSE